MYLGIGYLEPKESDRKEGPGRRHEELIYSLDGTIQVQMNDKEIILEEGEILFIPDGLKVRLTNLSKNRCYFMIAGGHTKQHKH